MPERNIKVICSMTMCEMGCSSSVGHSAGHWVGLRGFCMASYAMVAYINDSVFMTILSVTMKIRLWLQKGFELIAQWLCWATKKAQGKNCHVTLLQREFVSRRKAMNMSFHLYPIKRLSKMATFAKKAVTLKSLPPHCTVAEPSHWKGSRRKLLRKPSSKRICVTQNGHQIISPIKLQLYSIPRWSKMTIRGNHICKWR